MNAYCIDRALMRLNQVRAELRGAKEHEEDPRVRAELGLALSDTTVTKNRLNALLGKPKE